MVSFWEGSCAVPRVNAWDEALPTPIPICESMSIRVIGDFNKIVIDDFDKMERIRCHYAIDKWTHTDTAKHGFRAS